MLFSAPTLALAAIAAGFANAQFPENPANCPGSGNYSVQFTVKTILASDVGVNYGNMILNYNDTSSPIASIISVQGNDTTSSIRAFELSPAGSLTLILADPNSQNNTAISLSPPASAGYDSSSNFTTNVTLPADYFFPLYAVPEGSTNDTFVLLPFEGSQLLMPNPGASGFAQWVVCDTDGDNDPILAWTNMDNLTDLDFGTECNKVQLQITGCEVEIGAHP